MSVEELLTRWTIRLSLALYAVTLAALLAGRTRPAILREARLAWTVGCALLWLHVAAAFHFYHHWSHQAAYEVTARDTEQIIGWAFGGGVYFNYIFTVLWTVDAACWWAVGSPAYFGRPFWRGALFHGFLLFIVFNSTVPFGEGGLRLVAAGGFVVLAVMFFVIQPPRKSKAVPARRDRTLSS